MSEVDFNLTPVTEKPSRRYRKGSKYDPVIDAFIASTDTLVEVSVAQSCSPSVSLSHGDYLQPTSIGAGPMPIEPLRRSWPPSPRTKQADVSFGLVFVFSCCEPGLDPFQIWPFDLVLINPTHVRDQESLLKVLLKDVL